MNTPCPTYPLGHLIDGDLSHPESRLQDVFEPATGKVQGQVLLADVQTVESAIQSAATAFSAWAATTPQRRARILMRFVTRVEARIEEIATLLSREHGKTQPDAKAEIQRGLECMEYATGISAHLKGGFSDNVSTGIDTHAFRQPLGVVAGVTPFNFPAMIPMWMMGNALATGNTMVLKPSERDPSVPLLLAGLLREAGLPDGVLNVVNGDKTAVDALLESPVVQAVSFVGSSDIAESIYARGAACGKRVQAMGGAKNHMVILPDADMDQVVNGLLGAAFGSAGERCMAISVAVPVGQETADRLAEALKARVAELRVGPSLDPSSDFGPLVTRAHLERVRAFVDSGLREGAELLVDGRGVEVAGHPDGFYLGACVFDHVTADMEIYREEIFGPVLSILRVEDLDQALMHLRNHQYGNGVAIYTRSGHLAREFTRRVDVGMVGVNVPIPVPLATYSFGGWKRSAYGGYHQYGPEGVAFFTKLKNVLSRWPEEAGDSEFSMPTHR